MFRKHLRKGGKQRESNLEEEGPLRRVSVRVRAGGEVRRLWK